MPNNAPREHVLHLVFGASGYIGSNLVPYLRARGIQVRAASRRCEVLEARHWDAVDTCAADALEPVTLAAALDGVDTAYYLVHSMAAGKDFGQLDRRQRPISPLLPRTRACAGSSILADSSLTMRRLEHIQSRRDTGEIAAWRQGAGHRIRAGIIVGPGSAAFEVMRDLVYHLPVMVTPRWVRAKSPPIALDNLLEYLLQLPTYRQAVVRYSMPRARRP